jgi:hypothetical protein
MNESGSSRNIDGQCSITLSGTAAECDLIRQMLTGAKWIGTEDGQLWGANRFQPIPSPIEDPMVPPKWMAKVPAIDQGTKEEILEAMTNAKRFAVKMPSMVIDDVEPGEGWHYPAFTVQHLCGYCWTKERYAQQARLFTSWGFECCRSRRASNGRFYELWYLPFASSAKGDLKEVVNKIDKGGSNWRETSRAVVEWLCDNSLFGTLDVTVQRACVTID